MDYFKHPEAIVESENIGKNTRIWAFSHILPGASIGEDCNICDHTFIENDVVIGNRVTIKCGVQVWDGVVLEDDVFVGPNVTFTNDHNPRSKKYPEKFASTFVRKNASIGANATLLPVEIGRNAMVGAGAVVTANVPPNAIVVGNPARIKGYVDTYNRKTEQLKKLELTGELRQELKPSGACIYKLPVIEDLRGSLSVGEYEKHIPFIPKRYFVVYDVPTKEVRGEHAHRTLHQFLVCIKGSCCVVVDDGKNREEVRLDSPGTGLYIPPMIWATQYRYTVDAILLVLASDFYDQNEYIRDYDEFLKLLEKE